MKPLGNTQERLNFVVRLALLFEGLLTYLIDPDDIVWRFIKSCPHARPVEHILFGTAAAILGQGPLVPGGGYSSMWMTAQRSALNGIPGPWGAYQCFFEHSLPVQSGFPVSRPNPRLEVFLQVTARKIERLFVALQTAHHQAAFERAGYQRRQLRGVYLGPNLAF